ncbi:MAG: hypothetical protein AABY22_21845, partial [Nanoarchaeota archaeon]
GVTHCTNTIDCPCHKKCCEECFFLPIGDEIKYCNDNFCPCHSKEEKCKFGHSKDVLHSPHCFEPPQESRDTELFIECSKLFTDYFKRVEIEGMDMVVGHLAVIARDKVFSERAKWEEERKHFATKDDVENYKIVDEEARKDEREKTLEAIKKEIKGANIVGGHISEKDVLSILNNLK